jgi:hypothetical protein
MPDYLTIRKGYWHFVRRVPEELAALDRRGIVKHSTRVAVKDDRRGIKASQIAKQMTRALKAYWRGLLDGKVEEATKHYNAFLSRARIFGFDDD